MLCGVGLRTHRPDVATELLPSHLLNICVHNKRRRARRGSLVRAYAKTQRIWRTTEYAKGKNIEDLSGPDEQRNPTDGGFAQWR